MDIPLDETKYPKTIAISKQIANGASAFLVSEYQALAVFVVAVFACLCGIIDWRAGINFLVGAILSAASGWFGMKIATAANVRTTLACQGDDGLNNGLRVAFKSGSVMAMSVLGSGLLGVSVSLPCACVYMRCMQSRGDGGSSMILTSLSLLLFVRCRSCT